MADRELGFREARREITQAVSASTLATIFGSSTERVRERIGHLRPVAEYKGSPLYRIRDAAPFLVRPAGIDVEEIVRGLKPAQLPTALQKEFWGAQISRQKFEAEAGHLWRTEKIRDAVGEIFKVIRQRVMQFSDTVERQTGLTVAQRRLVQELSDGLLEEMHTAIVEHFKDFSRGDERDELYENGPPRTVAMPPPEDGDDGDDGEDWYDDDPNGGL
jgi:hypothetical protein